MLYNDENNGGGVDIITVVTKSKIVRVPVTSIDVVEQEGRKLHIITAEEDYVCYDSIENLVGILNNYSIYRIMKKIIVNRRNIAKVAGGQVNFISGATICMGRNKYSEMRKAYIEYLEVTATRCRHTSSSILAAEKVKLGDYESDEEE